MFRVPCSCMFHVLLCYVSCFHGVNIDEGANGHINGNGDGSGNSDGYDSGGSLLFNGDGDGDGRTNDPMYTIFYVF